MDEPERLRIEVQDERARRRWAERELAAESEKRALWRKRAEDRADRIKLLEERLDRPAKPQSIRGRLRALRRRVSSSSAAEPVAAEPATEPVAPAPAPPGASLVAERRRPPAFPTVRVAVLGPPPSFLEEFETVDVADDENCLYDSDFVFLLAGATGEAGESTLAPIRQWLELPARQPLVLWGDDSSGSTSAGAEWVAAADHQLSAQLLHNRLFPEYADRGVFAHTIDGAPLNHHQAIVQMARGIPAIARGVNTDLPSPADKRLAVAARRIAWRNASPVTLARTLLEVVGIDLPARSNQIGAILASNKPGLVVQAVTQLLRQKVVDLMPVIVLHGDAARFVDERRRIESMLDGGPGVVLGVSADIPLGEALNTAAASCASPLLAKIDDDDWYGDHYLEEAVYAMQQTGADVVGKASYYVEFEESQDVFLIAGVEEAFSNHVIGSSLVFPRRLWEEVPFPHRPSRVDSVFLRGVRAAGRTIYSTSRFDFAVRRRSTGHTWDVDPAHFAARGTRVGNSLEAAAIAAPDSLLGWGEPFQPA